MPGKTNWQDIVTEEILSSQITGLQHAVGKMEEVLDLKVVSATDEPLTLLADIDGVYRIAEAKDKRNWVASPAPVIKKAGSVITTGFRLDYGGGAVVFESGQQAGDVFTADFHYVTAVSDNKGVAGGYATLDNTGNVPADQLGNVPIPDLEAGNVEYDNTTSGLTAEDVQAAVDEVVVELEDHKAETATLSNLGHIKHSVLTTTLDTFWTSSSAPFTKTQTVAGILATDTPIVDIVMSGTFATDEARLEAWGSIYRITTANNSITLYAMEKPSVSLPIQLKVVR